MLRQPLWIDGIMPGAHHFQSADEYHRQSVQRAVARVNPDAWGFNELEFDEMALAERKVVLRRLELTLDDLTDVSVLAEDRPLTHDLPDLGTRESVNVYVALPAVQSGRPNAAPAEDLLTPARYRIATHQIRDEANGKPPLEAQWLRPIPWLLVDGDRMDGFDVVQCARVVSDSKGRPIFDRSFIPPIWRIRASPYLQERFEDLLARLRERKAWADNWHPLTPRKERRRALRGHLGIFVDEVKDLLDRNVTAPHDAYLKLLDILHTLAPFTPSGDAPLPAENLEDVNDNELPPYNHRDLSRAFRPLFDAARAVVCAIGSEQHIEVPLVPVDGNDALRQADLSKLPGIFRHQFYLAVSGPELSRLREEVPGKVRVAPIKDLLEFNYASYGGVPLQWTQRPNCLPELPGTIYFSMDKASAIWASVQREALLGVRVYVEGLTHIALYTVDPDLQ